MRKPVCFLYAFVWSTLLSISFTAASTAYAAELRPLNLPSSQRQYNMQAPVQRAAPVATPDVYDRFARQVESLNDSQKDQYRRSYQASLDQAISSQDKTSEAYYRKLLNILQ